MPVERVGGVRLGRQRSPDKQSGRDATPYIRAANITPRGLDLSDLLTMDFTPQECELYALRDGDVVLTEASGSATQVGRAALWPADAPFCCFQNTVIRFRPHAVDPRYAYIVFRHFSAAGVFAQAARGVGIQHLGASRLAQLPFPVPPRPEQERIADEVIRRLAALHEAKASLISARSRIEEQTREILAAASRGALIDPDVREDDPAPSQAPQPSDAPLVHGEQSSLFEDISARESTAHEAEPLWSGPLPSGWAWVRIADAGDLKLGLQRSPRREGIPTPYLRVANVQEDTVDLDDITLMDFTPAELQVYRLQRGDLLLNVGQSPELVGRPALIRADVPPMGYQNHLARFRPGPMTDGEFALLVFRHYMHAGYFRARSTWSTNLATLGVSRLAEMGFPLPPLPVQKQVAAEARRRLDASRAQAQAVEASIDNLVALEAELLATAVAGQLVPQDVADEPASSMLERLGVPANVTVSPAGARRQQGETSTMDANEAKKPPSGQPRLATVLLREGRAMRVSELFKKAGFDRDSVEDVESFYLSLRDELGAFVKVVGAESEDALLEAIGDATV